MNPDVEFLDLDDVLDLIRRLLGDPPPIRDIGLVGSAVARPQTAVFGQDAYPDIWSKAAALLQSIDNNQATVEAQKLFINQQSEEKARVNRRFDVELERLKKLWSGAAPGSLGPPPSGREGPEGSLGKGDAGAAPAELKSPKPASS